MTTQLVERFVVGVDVERYSSKNIRQQDETQRMLDQILSEAANAAGLNRQQWQTAPGGDGELAVLPADVDMVAVVGRFVSELDDHLATFNDDRVPAMKIRLRVAMHIDTVKPSTFGYAGPGLVVLSRLLDAKPLREALAGAADANLALLVSDSVFRKVVESGFGALRPRRFAEIAVDIPAKAFSQTAYLYIPGAAPELSDAGSARPAAGQNAQSITNAEVYAPVIHGDLNIGGVTSSRGELRATRGQGQRSGSAAEAGQRSGRRRKYSRCTRPSSSGCDRRARRGGCAIRCGRRYPPHARQRWRFGRTGFLGPSR